MKKLILFAALLFTQISFSQDFISENKLWHVKDFSWGIVNTEIFKFEGDTSINSYTYKKLWSTWDSSMTEFYLTGFLREESNVVYIMSPAFGEQILYDFNLEIGDTAMVFNAFCFEVQVVVTDTDTVEYFGIPRKRWILDGWTDDYWIEGIGSNYGLIYTKLYECVADVDKVLLCFHENDALLYILEGETECFQTNVGINEAFDSDNLKVFPNPVKSGQQIVVQCNDGINEVEIYNVYGKKVNGFMFDSTPEAIISTNDIGPDLYLIKIHTGKDDFVSGKIIIR